MWTRPYDYFGIWSLIVAHLGQVDWQQLLKSLPDYKTFKKREGKISAQPHTTLCIQFLNRENNDKNNAFPLGKQICFAIVWGCTETLPERGSRAIVAIIHPVVLT